MYDMERLHDVFDGAGAVVVDTEFGLTFIWNGSETFNIYNAELVNIDLFMVSVVHDAHDARRLIHEHISTMWEDSQ